MSKFYVKLFIPATEMFTVFQDYDSWSDAVACYEALNASGLISIIGRNEEAFQA